MFVCSGELSWFCRYRMIFSAGMLYYIVMCDVAGKVLLPTTGRVSSVFFLSFFLSFFFLSFFSTWEIFFPSRRDIPARRVFASFRFVSLVCMYCMHVCMYACARVCTQNITFGLLYARC
ncbi:hypothetical protein B9Z19DRAFT_416171 [Tuber borchii]|uniref:Uncharacterized protein n=1 Tax=Tuber borchii TaxID=42251 RepID=A0A2T7A3X6_TUBBO|nr:hypothetical protein B9Z19DRAFT_416171 [Tuber borchii]